MEVNETQEIFEVQNVQLKRLHNIVAKTNHA